MSRAGEPTHAGPADAAPDRSAHASPPPPLVRSLVRLARPKQWTKSAFVLVGPLYGFADKLESEPGLSPWAIVVPALLAALAFSLASSGCYVVNDILDREADREHPRKRSRPLAAGDVSVGAARLWAGVLFAASAATLAGVPESVRWWLAAALGLYVANVFAYSFYFKHKVIGDVISLSLGFVLRVVGGCVAIAIVPTTWLLNVSFFLSMFLAFGKRLGERRTLATGDADEGARAVAHRRVQSRYTDTLLQMAVVVTAVATLLTYAGYVQDNPTPGPLGFNPLWLTLVPATYGLLRAIVLLETGKFDDPTTLAFHDRGFLAAGLLFALLTAAAFVSAAGF